MLHRIKSDGGLVLVQMSFPCFRQTPRNVKCMDDFDRFLGLFETSQRKTGKKDGTKKLDFCLVGKLAGGNNQATDPWKSEHFLRQFWHMFASCVSKPSKRTIACVFRIKELIRFLK